MNKTILVSAGHSTVPPKDSGAVGHGFEEAKEALRVRDAVADSLRSYDLTVIEDGADGINEPLRKAIALARQAAVAVEFHFNAGGATASGIEVLAKADKKPLAKRLAGAIQMATGLALRGGDGGYKSDSSGQHHRLGFCEAGGLIVEIAFISNAGDMARYQANFNKIVERVAEVLANSVGATKKDTSGASNAPELTDASQTYYTVKAGDTLTRIASLYGEDYKDVMKLNNLTDDKIKVGQRLRVK